MIYTVTLNPALDKTAVVRGFDPDGVNRVSSVRRDPGGKGVNVSKVVRALGGESVAMALLGGASGAWVEDALAREGIALRARHVQGETRTNLKLVDPVAGTHADVNEPGEPVEPDEADALRGELVALLEPDDVVVLAGSLPRGVPADAYAGWVRACAGAGARVVLDADGSALAAGVAAGPCLVKPNAEELARLVGRELSGTQEVLAAARELVGRGVGCVVVSLGAQGAVLADGAQAWRARAPQVSVGSTVGAGDAMVAVLAMGLERGWMPARALALAVAAGSASVMQSGTQAPDRALVEGLAGRVDVERLA